MKLILLVVVMVLFFCGCGNSTLETMVYEKYGGKVTAVLYKREAGYYVFPSDPTFNNELLKKYPEKHDFPITEITSRRGKLKDVWEVWIYFHETVFDNIGLKIEEYSFRDGKMRFIRVVECISVAKEIL